MGLIFTSKYNEIGKRIRNEYRDLLKGVSHDVEKDFVKLMRLIEAAKLNPANDGSAWAEESNEVLEHANRHKTPGYESVQYESVVELLSMLINSLTNNPQNMSDDLHQKLCEEIIPGAIENLEAHGVGIKDIIDNVAPHVPLPKPEESLIDGPPKL